MINSDLLIKSIKHFNSFNLRLSRKLINDVVHCIFFFFFVKRAYCFSPEKTFLKKFLPNKEFIKFENHFQEKKDSAETFFQKIRKSDEGEFG